MGYLFLMTLAGSILFVGFLCWERLLGKSLTQCIKYRALTLTMFAYAVPWVWIKGIYRSVVELFWPGEVAMSSKLLINLADIETKETAFRTKKYQLLILIMSIWFAVAVTRLINRIVKSLRRTHVLHTLAIKCEDKDLEETMELLRDTVHYGRKLEIVWTRVDNRTFVTGTIKPVIFLQKQYADGDLYWILKHEITHIVNMDLWVKLLLEFVCCLHWFNPFIYLLARKIKYLSETFCDETVIKGCTEEEKQKYMDLLDRNKGSKTVKNLIGSDSESSKGETDKRIALMKNMGNIGPKEKVGTVVAFGLLVFLNSLTALAYPDIHHVKNAVIEMAEDAVDGNNFWTYEYTENKFDMSLEVILYDEQFVDGEKRIYPTVSVNESSCYEHDFTRGVIQIHTRDEDGGCRVETYEGLRCIKCGATQKGELLHRAKKTFCTH